MLASLLFPYDDDAPGLIDGWLDELERESCITRYEANGSTFLFINNWLIHQKIDKPSKPQFPEPSETLAKPREDSCLEGKGREGKGEEESAVETSPAERKSAKPSEALGTRLAKDWQPHPDELRWATDARPDIDLSVEVESFRDYWIAKPGKDGRKSDWPATWRNWIRRANPSRGHAPKNTTATESVAASRPMP